MKEQISTGMNRTGVQSAPSDPDVMQSRLPPSMMPATPGDDSALARIRSSYIAEAGTVGSIPLPASPAGAQLPLLLDKLGERLAFERAGTRLYDALITKFEATQDASTSMTLADLQQIRQDEVRHCAMLAEAIATLGGDPTSQTPCADIAGVESAGLMQVVTDPRTTIAHALHALLVAELADQAGWEMLIALAEGARGLIADCSVALDEERLHLAQVQRWHEEAVLGVAISDGALIDDIGDANPSRMH